MFTEILNSLLEALIDCLKMAPILFLVYLLIEYLTHKKEEKFLKLVSKDKKTGIIMGATVGCIPQCGFSLVLADMFNHKMIGIGTLIAVFVATSDEALPILISQPNQALNLLLIIAIKFVLAIIFGYAIHFIFLLLTKVKHQKENLAKDGAIINSQEYLVSHDCQIEEHHHNHEHEHKKSISSPCDCCSDNIFLNALKHTLEILIYILIFNIVINLFFLFVGEEVIINALNVSPILQIIIAPIIGLIPNCISSVVLVELFVSGALTFPALIGGLCAGSGVGLLILFKNKKNIKENLFILISLYLIGVLSGFILSLFF